MREEAARNLRHKHNILYSPHQLSTIRGPRYQSRKIFAENLKNNH